MIPELSWVALALAAGLPLVLRLAPAPRDPSSRAGEAILLGSGVCAATLALLPWSRWIVVAAVLAIAAIAFFWRRNAEAPPVQHRDAFLAIVFVILLLSGYALYATLARPPEYDFLTDWGFKAKAFFEVRAIDWPLLEHGVDRSAHPDYPLLVPLTYDFIAVLRGSWNDAQIGIVQVVFAAALLLLIHSAALEETRSRIAAAFVVIALMPFAATPWIGLADGPFIAYATAALLLIRRRDVTLGAIFIGLAASTKNEGLTLIAAAAIALLCAGRKRDVLRLWPAVVIPLPWIVLRSTHGLVTDLAEGNLPARLLLHLQHPGALAAALASYSLGKPLYWIALAIGLAIAFRTIVARERFILIALLVQFACYLGAYLATPFDVVWHVTWSWERLVAHLTPALTYIVLLALIAPRAVSEPAAQS